MAPPDFLMLVGAGLAAGFIAGLIGVGGGIIFAPVLFFHFHAIGVSAAVIAPLTIGSSLFCTLIASLVSASVQYGKGAVSTRTALHAGLFSALAVILMTRFVTTRPWYDAAAFQIVFSLVLLFVAARMIVRPDHSSHGDSMAGASATRWPVLAGTGTAAGAVAAAAGVGGGIVLVPAYERFLRMPIHRATGTSSATIALISLAGVLNYAWIGWSEPVPEFSLGYVDVLRALLLAGPAVLTANAGVRVAHRMNRRALRLTFAGIAAIVAVRLLWRTLH